MARPENGDQGDPSEEPKRKLDHPEVSRHRYYQKNKVGKAVKQTSKAAFALGHPGNGTVDHITYATEKVRRIKRRGKYREEQ